MVLRNRKGFTLIEVIVVAGIIAVLAGILVPLIFKEIDESKVSRAYADVRSISSAMIVFRKDVGQWPVTSTCRNDITLLSGSGTLPTITGADWNSGTEGSYDDSLNADTAGCWAAGVWKGPYMATVNADPWGHKYFTNADSFGSTTGPIWIISAGPDGDLQTAASGQKVPDGSDDVGIRLR